VKYTKRKTGGFTLSELLVSVAILIILLALATPSIISAQRNMHLTELDNDANSIAIAAQSTMTKMKVAGTWLPMLNKNDDYKSQSAHSLPEVKNEKDIYCFTAEQAKANGIVLQSSIEESVYKGDFIIEYSRSSASVCGVFYSDGKNGILDFSDPEPGSTPAQNYYAALGNSSGREHDALACPHFLYQPKC
jgi:type II secretory pathway pseudopilin PulG